MPSRLNGGTGTTALSIVITLFATSLASAQSPNATPAAEASTHTSILSGTAFARLAHVTRPEPAPPGVAAQATRPSLLRQGTAAMARQAQATPQQQRSWVSRHKVALGYTIVLVAILLPIIYGALGGFE